MEAKELMHLDWIQINGRPSQVRIEDIFNLQQGKFEAEPIYLTKDIMLSNGWNFVRGNVYGRKFDEEINGKNCNFPVPFRVFISDAYCYEKMFPTINEDILCAFLYVHELQHALRHAD